MLVETAARQRFAAEPLYYLMDLAATLFPANMAAAAFATHRGETHAAAIVVFFGPAPPISTAPAGASDAR